MLTKLILGLCFSWIIAGVAYKKKSLSKTGLLASIILGTFIFSFGDLVIYLLMIFFFITGSILSRLKMMINVNPNKNLKESECRNYTQVFANGGIPFICTIIYIMFPSDSLIVASSVAFAGATSDTWASEIGILSLTPPKYLLSKKNQYLGFQEV